MNNNDTTDIITENKWFRLCPKCGQSIIFSSKFSCEASYGINPLCVECASPKSPGGQRKRRCNKTAQIICEDNDGFIATTYSDVWLRKCPMCAKRIYHRGKSAEANCRVAVKSKRICSKCNGKKRYEVEGPPKDFTFEGKTHTPETIEKQCVAHQNWWNDVHEANNIIASNSGSCLCKPMKNE